MTHERYGRLLVLVATLLCAGCGTYKLNSGHLALQGQTKAQQEHDVLFCKDQAELAANSPGMVTGAFFLGFSVVGYPIARVIEKAEARGVFAECLTARGYTVYPVGWKPGDDPPKSAVQPSCPPASAGLVLVPNSSPCLYQPAAGTPIRQSPAPSAVSLTLPEGWARLPLTADLSTADAVLYAINRTIDAGAFLTATKREGITDLAVLAHARRASQASALTDPQSSEILPVDVAGKKGFRFTVAGALKNGMRLTYLVTIIEGGTEIAVLNAWTATANFEHQRSAMERLAVNVTGL